MSNTSVSTSNSTKVFTWASVAGGKKQTQADLEAERTKVKEQEVEKKRQLLEKYKEAELRTRLITEKREHEFATQNASRLARIAQQEQEAAEYCKRENGYWALPVKPRHVIDEAKTVYTGWTRYRILDVPRNVNARAMKFIEHMLVNYPEVTSTCPTLGDFKQVFVDAYMGYLVRNFGKSAIENITATRAIQYEYLQTWAIKEETEYKEAIEIIRRNQGGIVPAPPWFNKLWVFAKNVNFENCLWAMNSLSKTFEMETVDETTGKPNTGFVKIASNTLPSASKLTWLTNLETYEGFPHETKPMCKEKKEQQEREAREESWD